MKGTVDKKKLRLLPEILPDPSPDLTPGGPRQRVLARVSRLSALAAAVATAQSGCSADKPGNGGTTPPTVEIPGTSGTAVAVDNPTSHPTSAPTNNNATNVPQIPSGYAVVDPMPPPAVCMGVAPTIQAKATWKAKKGGFSIEVKLSKPGRADASYRTNEEPSAWDATLPAKQVAADTVTLTLEPTAGAKYAGARVPTTCSRGDAHLQIELDLSQAPSANAAIPVTLSDTW
jgi:hypothetical protein